MVHDDFDDNYKILNGATLSKGSFMMVPVNNCITCSICTCIHIINIVLIQLSVAHTSTYRNMRASHCSWVMISENSWKITTLLNTSVTMKPTSISNSFLAFTDNASIRTSSSVLINSHSVPRRAELSAIQSTAMSMRDHAAVSNKKRKRTSIAIRYSFSLQKDQ